MNLTLMIFVSLVVFAGLFAYFIIMPTTFAMVSVALVKSILALLANIVLIVRHQWADPQHNDEKKQLNSLCHKTSLFFMHYSYRDSQKWQKNPQKIQNHLILCCIF